MNLLQSIVYKFFRGSDRQSFHIGWLPEGKTLEELREYLHKEWGFGGKFPAKVEKGEVLSWRKLEGKDGQYHLRVYQDGEIRGHLEYTPESHPIDYLVKSGMKDKSAELANFLGDFVTSNKFVSNLVADPNVYNPSAERIKEEEGN